ncbi:cytochrome ubiquinol oxidase subunit I [Paenibacillus sp. VTT E-133280]|uniref:cytochrome ubiquinol oxidase subunit I n=1 Tax=Paenibacillus TaxID=44249 RepID=UPI00061F0BE5|nr:MULTISPECIES: cytochrome ubiquinol oxidase subunit I [Paenibacillus]KKC47783.1 cytochrome D ubiquinol oxidase subunit I [Paenibacillus sp. D9]MEC0259841.1 cytochrome ubiquinol oxidase subunit I [Paenibacillus lautus]OZQ68818.1 cytochrome ubiquinol oxidase subunit I [Paenibacillus sp. VTT E-133280]
MNTLEWSRGLTEMTLAFHILFATVGVGIPIFISIAELMGIRKKDPHYTLMARRWTRGFVITVAVGVVTGTCIGLQLSLLWPEFMRLAGNVISLPLFLETFAFFFEAIFLGIYLYTWNRFKNPYLHWLLTIPIVIGSSASALFITMVNAFMNTPQGFTVDNGNFLHIDPMEAMFNPAMPSKVAHVLSSAYLTAAFLLAMLAAFSMLRGRKNVYYKKSIRLNMITGLILAVATIWIGDGSAKFLAKVQPEKLAAAEWHFETGNRVSLIVGGHLNPDTLEVTGAIEIPWGLSFLATGDPNGTVVGLNDFPRSEWPPLYVHYLFDSMVGIGFYLLAIPVLFLTINKIKRWNAYNRWLLTGIVAGGPLSLLAIELGWFYAEVGRQPWIIRGYMKVSDAVTTNPNVGVTFWLFAALYALLGVICLFVLGRLFRNKPAEMELEERRIIL